MLKHEYESLLIWLHKMRGGGKSYHFLSAYYGLSLWQVLFQHFVAEAFPLWLIPLMFPVGLTGF